MADSSIYLDASAGNPSVITIAGSCYRLVAPTSFTPGTPTFDGESCSACPSADCTAVPPATASVSIPLIKVDDNYCLAPITTSFSITVNFLGGDPYYAAPTPGDGGSAIATLGPASGVNLELLCFEGKWYAGFEAQWQQVPGRAAHMGIRSTKNLDGSGGTALMPVSLVESGGTLSGGFTLTVLDDCGNLSTVMVTLG